MQSRILTKKSMLRVLRSSTMRVHSSTTMRRYRPASCRALLNIRKSYRLNVSERLQGAVLPVKDRSNGSEKIIEMPDNPYPKLLFSLSIVS
jgi:hypothetical protein